MKITLKTPDKGGHFGPYGGRYVAETLMPALIELEAALKRFKKDRRFWQRFDALARDYIGRPTPLYFAARLTQKLGGGRIFLKREDLCHTGAHKVNNTLGQCLMAKAMGKTRVIAETGAGQHGVATATLCALLDLDCEIYMGREDCRRQELNVFRMRLLGARVQEVLSGTQTLKDAMNEALRDWVTHVRTTFYCIGTVAGPHPYPVLVREFQSIIGHETKKQLEKCGIGRPDYLVACIGGGSNAIGLFAPYIADRRVRLIGVEAAGHGLRSGRHAASIAGGHVGILHGNRTYLLQDRDGQIKPTHSISAGLDYPGVGPEHAWLKDSRRARYVTATDREALRAFQVLAETEGIIPALESAHALAHVMKMAPRTKKSSVIIVNLSGRGDKDMVTVAQQGSLKSRFTQS